MPRVPFPRAALAAALALAMSSSALPATAGSSRGDALAATTRSTVETVWHGAQDLAIYALGMIGVDYRWGGESPDSGLDCSGLVRHVFQTVTGVTLPRTSKELSRIGAPIQRGDLKPGDLVFFDTRRFAFSHVGIYLGDDRFIHAPSRGSEVEIAELSNGYWRKHFNGARRLVGVLPGLVQSAEASTIVDAPAAAAR
ncbi:MAG TPA: C40 family peptidase [Casimicrobiaceae bacterium]|nr:C40 family peptidase [Casimicrobiaceae bacterium]